MVGGIPGGLEWLVQEDARGVGGEEANEVKEATSAVPEGTWGPVESSGVHPQ